MSVHQSGQEYRQGQYVFQSSRDAVADYQQSAAFRNGAQDILS